MPLSCHFHKTALISALFQFRFFDPHVHLPEQVRGCCARQGEDRLVRLIQLDWVQHYPADPGLS